MNVAYWISCLFATLTAVQLPGQGGPALLDEMQFRVQATDSAAALLIVTRFEPPAQVTSTTRLIHLSKSQWTDTIKEGADGIQMDVVVPDTLAIEASFANADGELGVMSRMQRLGPHKRYSFRFGNVLPTPEIESFALNATEQQQLSELIDATNSSELASLASPEPTSNVDATCLEQFNQFLLQRIGKASHPETPAQWYAWSLGDELRSMVGEVSFERGKVEFEIEFRDGKLTQLNWQSSQVPPTWFTPSDPNGDYQQKAELLTKLLLTDQAAMARRQFAVRLQEEIPVQSLAKLSASLQEAYGTAGFETRLIGTRPSVRSGTPILLIRLLHTFADGRKAISEATFLFPNSGKSVPIGELSNIYFSQAWTTAAPERARVAEAFVTSVFAEDSNPTGVIELLGPAYCDAIDEQLATDSLGSFLQRTKAQHGIALVEAARECDFDKWSFLAGDAYSQVSGSLQIDSAQPINITLSFDDDTLTGFSLQTGGTFFASADYIGVAAKFNEAATKFWKSLLSEQRDDAYALLSPALKQRMARDDLDVVAVSSGLPKPERISYVQTRQSTRLDRSAPLTVSVFCIAEFDSGIQQPLRCDFDLESEAPAIVEFTSDFTENFRVDPARNYDGTGDLASRLRPLLMGNATDVQLQTQPSRRKFIDLDILDAFLTRAQELLEIPLAADLSKRISNSGSLTHTYVLGSRREVGALVLDDIDGAKATVRVTTELGQLTSFHIDTNKLQGFIPEFQLKELAAARTNRFIGAWLSGESLNESALSELTVASLQSEETIIGFKALRAKLLARIGDFDGVDCSPPIIGGDGREIEVNCRVLGKDSSANLTLVLELDAISLRIASIELSR